MGTSNRYSEKVSERAVRMVSERDSGKRAGMSTAERDRLKERERENRELKRAKEILRKASEFFAQAELDCRVK
jgi:transposase